MPLSWLRGAARRPSVRPHRARLCVEQLEPRALPAAGPQIFLAASSVTPNDPSFSAQYDMTKISAPTAWATTTGSAKVTVAVIDTGIDYTHPDLYLNVWINQGEIPNRDSFADVDHDGLITFRDLNAPDNLGKVPNTNQTSYIDAADILAAWSDGTDADGNGYVDDLIGWNFIDNNNNPLDGYGHGTHVSGTIGAVGNNKVGVAGVNWSTSLMALRIGDNAGNLSYQAAIDAIDYAANNGARVSNASWIVTGGQVGDPLYNAINYANSKGLLVVAAAGNNGFNNDKSPWRSYPASFDLPNIISVTATDSKDQQPHWANYGKTSVDLGAPGVNVYSTVPGGYAYYSGTSMATPHVVGTAALILAQNPTLTSAQVKADILNNTDPVSSLAGRTVTGGRLDTAKALANASTTALASTTTTTTTTTSNGKGGKVETTSVDTSVGSDAEADVEASLVQKQQQDRDQTPATPAPTRTVFIVVVFVDVAPVSEATLIRVTATPFAPAADAPAAPPVPTASTASLARFAFLSGGASEPNQGEEPDAPPIQPPPPLDAPALKEQLPPERPLLPEGDPITSLPRTAGTSTQFVTPVSLQQDGPELACEELAPDSPTSPGAALALALALAGLGHHLPCDAGRKRVFLP